MRKAVFAFVILCLVACTPAGGASGPSQAILDMEKEFERQVIAIEPQHKDDADGLRNAAIDVAASVYGKDWNVVRAEAKRSLAALPEIDLAPYETAQTIAPANDIAAMSREMATYMTPGGMAAIRFWDARFVGGSIGPMFVNIAADGDSASMIGMKLTLFPTRIYKGQFKGADVIATRYMSSLVVTPYTLTSEGMILPQLDKATVYAYRP